MERRTKSIRNQQTNAASSCPETKKTFQNFFGDIQKRVMPSNRHAQSDSKHVEKGKKKVVDQQNAMVSQRSNKSKLFVALPSLQNQQQCGSGEDKENVKATKRAFHPFDESTYKNRPVHDPCKRQRTVDVVPGGCMVAGVQKLGEIQNTFQHKLSNKAEKKPIVAAIKPRIVTVNATSSEKEEQPKGAVKVIKKSTGIPVKKKAGGGFMVSLPKALPKHLPVDSMNLAELSSVISGLMDAPPDGVIDIDSGCVDHFLEPTYARDYIEYLQEHEKRFKVSRAFLSDGEISFNMRAILVDWLIQVQNHLSLQQETLHATVMLVNAYIDRNVTALSSLQLLGITALFIASKVHERFAPEIDKLIHLTDNTYKHHQVISLELVVLEKLDFDVHPPGPIQFLGRFMRCVPHHEKLRPLCEFMMDLSLTDSKCVFFTASQLAASCITLARMLIMESEQGTDAQEPAMTPELRFYSDYMEAQIYPCMQRLAKLLLATKSAKLQGATEKYASFTSHAAISRWPPLQGCNVLFELVHSPSMT